MPFGPETRATDQQQEIEMRADEPDASDTDNDQAAAGAPVVAVVSGPAAMLEIQNWTMFRAFHVRATSPGGMQLTRNFRATVKGFNEAYGFNCRNWAEVAEVTQAVYAERDRADDARRETDR